MAWVAQTFKLSDFEVELDASDVYLRRVEDSGEERAGIMLAPRSQDEAHSFALMLRRAARRLEEIGRGLS